MSPTVLLNATQLKPSDKWLASALMFADKISTITVHEKGFYYPELKDQELWVPSTFGSVSVDQADLLVKEVEALNELYHFVDSKDNSHSSNQPRDFLYQEKFHSSLQEALIKNEILDHEEDDQRRHRLVGNRGFINAVLNLAGGYVAKQHEKEGWILEIQNTTEAQINLAPLQPESQPESLDFDQSVEMGNQNTLGQSLGIPFPILAPGTTLKDVLLFRGKHDKKFNAFQASLSSITRKPLEESSMEGRFKEYLEAVEELMSAATRSRLNLKTEARKVIRTLKTADSWATGQAGFAQNSAALIGRSLTVYEGVNLIQDVVNLDNSTLLVAGVTLSLRLVTIRQSSPTAYLKKAVSEGLIV